MFFFDRTFGTRLPGALKRLKPPVGIRWHQEQGFPQNMKDDEWMAVVGPRGWIVVSQDRKWHVIEAEKAAVRQHDLRCLYLPMDDRWEMLCLFTRHHKKMIDAISDQNGPYIK
ncbi:MAG: hypothetical protein ACQEVT_18275, partial [Pseudomonadota bacterium]